jgi:hypothetical protein
VAFRRLEVRDDIDIVSPHPLANALCTQLSLQRNDSGARNMVCVGYSSLAHFQGIDTSLDRLAGARDDLDPNRM